MSSILSEGEGGQFAWNLERERKRTRIWWRQTCLAQGIHLFHKYVLSNCFVSQTRQTASPRMGRKWYVLSDGCGHSDANHYGSAMNQGSLFIKMWKCLPSQSPSPSLYLGSICTEQHLRYFALEQGMPWIANVYEALENSILFQINWFPGLLWNWLM